MRQVLNKMIKWTKRCHFQRMAPNSADKSLYLLFITSLVFGHYLKSYMENEEVVLSILHTDSIAGSIKPKLIRKGNYQGEYAGGLSLMAGTLKKLRQENSKKNYHSLIFDTGNAFFSGSNIPLKQKENSKLIAKIFNITGHDAMVLRNEDYNFGDLAVDEISRIMGNTSFISTNYIGKNLEKLKLIEIITINNIKVGVIGITMSDLFKKNFQNLANSMIQIDTDLALKKSLQYLKKVGVDLTVMLSGIDDINEEIRIAKKYGNDIDVILSSCFGDNKCGHPIFIDNIPIVKINSEVPSIGKLDITLNLKRKKITRTQFKSYPLLLSQTSGDTKVEKLIKNRYQNFDQRLSERIIGRALIDFWDREDGESLYGNFVCDTVLSEYKDHAPVDAVFINSSNIRELPIGRITIEDVLNSIPYDNRLVTMAIRGDAIRDLLIKSYEKKDHIGVLQTAGIRSLYKIEDDQVTLVSATINDKPINPDQFYHIITTDYLALGGDGHANFLRGKVISYHRKLKKVIIDYIRTEREIVSRIDGRIQEWDGSQGRLTLINRQTY